MHNDLAILILSAGSSSRLGHPKQLVMYHDETLLRRSVQQALELTSHVFVVLGHAYEACASCLEDLAVTLLYHQEYAKGIGSSIAFGITHTLSFDYTLIMLCDQPLIPLEHYRSLIRYIGQECLVASSYLPKERVAVPAIFPKRYYEHLMALSGDKGAQMLLADASCIHVALKQEFTVDIDTQEDIEKYLQ
ncbi:MAG: MobA-like molybdenum cofactor biosynthesis protein [Proteobacteria bacterium]|nr:MobA-like molybdenum cofactor biosynthesis protein [Pseudomonadota bacterium]